MEEETITALKTQQDKYEQILSLRNEEISEFVDSIIKENCALKRQLILNEIDISKYQEMLSNACIKYYNLETGNMNETDRLYYEAIRNINNENDRKLNEINEKYSKTTNQIIKEHNELVEQIKKATTNKQVDTNNNNINMTLINLKERVDSYETKIKTLQEELFNSEKYCQILQTKYENLLQENKMIKQKTIEEKNNILFLIDELKKKFTSEKDKISIEFQKQSDIITQTFISFSNNELNKENLILDTLYSEKNEMTEKVNNLKEEISKLKNENMQLKQQNSEYEEYISKKELQTASISEIKAEYEQNLKKYEEENLQIKNDNLEQKKTISDLTGKNSALEKKVELIQNAIDTEIQNINTKNKKIIDDLNNQLLQLDQQRRELTYSNNNFNINNNSNSNLNRFIK